jgi:hypothetical protein
LLKCFVFFFNTVSIYLSARLVEVSGKETKLKAVLTTGVIIAAWWGAENIPAPLVTPLALLALAGIFTGLVVAGIKWVRNA